MFQLVCYGRKRRCNVEEQTARIEDQNGFIEVRDNPISKVGVFPYLGRSIGAPNPDQIYMVYRPAEELSSVECIESFKLVPIINDHTMLGDGATPAEEKGIDGTTGEDVYFDGEILYSNLKFFTDKINNLIDIGKRELSCGYRCEYEFANGLFNGVEFQAVQRKIRGNHVALVNEGRMGKEVAVLDSMVFTFDLKEISTMEEETKPVETQSGEMGLEQVIEALKTLAPQVQALMSFMNQLKPLEEEEHGVTLDDEVGEDEIGEDKKTIVAPADEEKKPEAAMDAAEIKRSVIKEIAQRDALYGKVSSVIGAFDHAEMSLKQVAKYSVKKIGLTCMDGAEVATLNGYLAGVAVKAKPVGTMDAKMKDNATALSYIQGEF